MPNSTAHDLIVRHRIGLERYGVALNKKILTKLNKAEADIIGKIAAMPALSAGTLGPTNATRQHLEAMLSQVRATSVEAMAVINSMVETELGDLAVHEVEFLASTYKAALPFATNFVTPAPQLLKAIVTTRPLQGRYIKDWLAAYPDQIKQKIHDAVLLGVMEGEGIGQIVNRIRGTRALNYGDAVLKGTKRGTEALVRTAVNHVSNAAHKALLDDNADVFDRYQWISVLDARTTPVCRSRAGRVYANSASSASPIPPAHVNCRSTIAPVIIGEEIEPVNDYAKWLAGQSAAVQRDVLGPAKHKLWLDGKMTIDKFVADTGRPLTLDQLKAADAAAWKSAFGNKAPGEVALNPGSPISSTPPAPLQSALQSTAKAKKAAQVKIVETAEEIAAKKAAEAQLQQQIALEAAQKAAIEAAAARKVAALARIDLEANASGELALKQKVSSSADVSAAQKYAGQSAQIAKAGGQIADVPLDHIEIVYGGPVSAQTAKAIVENFDPDKPVYAAKIGNTYHLIEGKSVLAAANAMKSATIRVQFIDATAAVAAEAEAAMIAAAAAAEAAKAATAAAKAIQAQNAKIAKATAAARAAGKSLKLTDQEIMTVRHEVAQAKDGRVFYKLKTADHEYFEWAGRFYNDVTVAQRSTIDNYKGSGYSNINATLRNNKGDRKAISAQGGTVAKQIAEMDKAIVKNQIPVDILAMRGFDIRHSLGLSKYEGKLPAGFRVDDMVGREIRDDGFMSFSVRENAPASFARNSAIEDNGDQVSFIMETVMKRGTPVLRGTDYEQEIIRKGGGFRVTGVREATKEIENAVGRGYTRVRFYVLEVEEIIE